MLYWVRRWRLSDLNFLPSSRQTRWSAVIDFFTETAGFSGSAGCSLPPDETRHSAACTWLINPGMAPAATELLLTNAETISAVSSMKLLLPVVSAIAQSLRRRGRNRPQRFRRDPARRRTASQKSSVPRLLALFWRRKRNFAPLHAVVSSSGSYEDDFSRCARNSMIEAKRMVPCGIS